MSPIPGELKVAIASSDHGDLAKRIAGELKALQGFQIQHISPAARTFAGGSAAPPAFRHQIEAHHMSPEARTREFFSACERIGPDVVLLANYWMRLAIPSKWLAAVANVHGSLLPLFGGRGFFGSRLYEAIVESGVEHTGATLHWATDDYDVGDIILQRRVQIEPGDTAAVVQSKTEEAEIAIVIQWLQAEKARRLPLEESSHHTQSEISQAGQ